MATSSYLVDPAVAEYAARHSSTTDDVMSQLIAETLAVAGDQAIMQVSPEQALLLQILTALTGATNALELGTFTGMSSIAIARGLGAGGRLVTCDISEVWTDVAKRYWKLAELEDRIELRLERASEVVAALPETAELDLVFVDAEKPNYPALYEQLVPRMRRGGLLLFDNVFWERKVMALPTSDVFATAIGELNERICSDRRVEAVMLPVFDGLTLARKL